MQKPGGISWLERQGGLGRGGLQRPFKCCCPWPIALHVGHLNHPGNNRSVPRVPPFSLAVLTASSLADDGGEQGVSQELITLPGGEGRLRASLGHHSSGLRGSPTRCPPQPPAGQMLKNHIAEVGSPPARSCLLMDALRLGSR